MIIFDFDKTLINKDTLYGFYKAAHGNNLSFKFKRIILIISAILYKLKLLNNEGLKKVGVKLFLSKKSKKDLEKCAEIYVKTLDLNSIYQNIFLKYKKEERVIISASPEIYLKKIFPDEKVLGTTLIFEGENTKLGVNCYNFNKLKRFNEAFPNSQIEAVYSDSYADKPLLEKSSKFFIVKDGFIVKRG